jgi:glyoxylase-like metal-dependent hydrolase (beta-lactamase superfamily II)
MQIFSIDTGFFKLDGGAMFGVVPKSIWNKENAADENNMCSWAMRCLLIIDSNRKILIDTGMGKKQSEKFFGYYYPYGENNLISSLASHGVAPDEITDVILTHLHFDHCGGAVCIENGELVLTFKNAIYWSNETHWNEKIFYQSKKVGS